MSEPLDKREEVEVQRYETFQGSLEDGQSIMVRNDSEGEWVKYSEYENLEAANREKDAELSLLRSEAAENARIIGMSGSREAAKDAQLALLRQNHPFGAMYDKIQKLHAELASLRASSGEKPEDAWKRGNEQMRHEVIEQLNWHGLKERGAEIGNWLIAPYVAPPSQPTEKEK